MTKVWQRPGHAGVPDEFLELPHVARAGDPSWIPEEPDVVAAAFSSTNPWFEHREAATLIVPGAARAAVFHDPAVRIDGRPAACIGFWESLGDDHAERALVDAAAGWARARGAAILAGPVNFGTYGDYRFRVTGDDEPPFFGEPHNPPRYPERFGALGFRVHASYVTQIGPMPRGAMRERLDEHSEVIRHGYRFAPLDVERWMSRAEECRALVNDSFRANPGFAPLDAVLFRRLLGERFIARVCPELSFAAIAPDGALAGIVLVHPHYGPLLVQGAGPARALPSRLNYAEHGEAALAVRRAAVLKTVAVAPQHRRRGLMNALIVEVLRRAEDRFDWWYGALIRENNPSRRFADAASQRERRYALYTMELTS